MITTQTMSRGTSIAVAGALIAVAILIAAVLAFGLYEMRPSRTTGIVHRLNKLTGEIELCEVNKPFCRPFARPSARPRPEFGADDEVVKP